jgi:catalase
MAGMPAANGNHNNQGAGVNFYPNDGANGLAAPVSTFIEPAMPILQDAWIKRYDTDDDDHYTQAGNLFRLMDEAQKNQLASNIGEGLVQATADVQQRLLEQFAKADQDYAHRVKLVINHLK